MRQTCTRPAYSLTVRMVLLELPLHSQRLVTDCLLPLYVRVYCVRLGRRHVIDEHVRAQFSAGRPAGNVLYQVLYGT